ncbi:hypothetical protein JI435_020440 [Parastagonospora nodorum SN15]|uniref:Uncharacterized protein n=1 Tax=Phaeosphaeria nodorum (strain SN15 / ATCC MYA-4574 / FGSC 10173) TaxID=321614 RepID=A0A7U2HVH9_PHANO|nr:hypothetical protein JI435_020440 [Parastagonospora nodorum SN15]
MNGIMSPLWITRIQFPQPCSDNSQRRFVEDTRMKWLPQMLPSV